ncbi:MAG: DsrE family protein [Acetobacteraceae bacterium]
MHCGSLVPLSVRSSVYVRIFLIGAAVACARSHPESRADADEAEALVNAVIQRGSDVEVCGTCAEEDEECQGDVCRGDPVAGTTQSSLTELSRWISDADQVLVF